MKEKGNRRQSLFLLGFSFWQAWQMFVLSTNMIVSLPMNASSGYAFSTFWMYGAVVFGLLLAIGVKRWLVLPFVAESSCAGLFAFVGTVMVSASSAMGMMQSAAFIGGVMCCGFGSGMLLLEWAEFWSTLAQTEVVKSVCSSYALAFLILLVLAMLPKEVTVAGISLLLLFSTWALQQGRKAERRLPPKLPLPAVKPPLLRMYAVIVALSATFGLSQSFYRMTLSELQYQDLVVAGVCMAVLAARFILSTEDDDPIVLYKIALPLVAGGVAVMVAMGGSLSPCGFGLDLFGVYCLDALIIVVGTDMAFRLQKPVVYVFGLAFFASRLASFSARLLSFGMVSAGVWDYQSVQGVLIGALFLLVVVGFLVFPPSELHSLYRVSKPSASEDAGLDAACAAVAESYGLTAREAEVLQYLAHGRSVPYMCERLCISQNTGKRHTSNIYRKLCIYNRQSLHDLVEHYRNCLSD